MATFLTFGLVFFGAILLALLQLPLGTLLLLYHTALGRPSIRLKTRSLVTSYIAGVMLADFLLLAAACSLVPFIFFLGISVFWARFILFLLLLGLSVFILCFYYRRPSNSLRRSTELWLPRQLAHFLNSRAKVTKSLPETFSLGFTTVIFEIPFSFPLFCLAAFGMLNLPSAFQLATLPLFSLLSVLPLLALRLRIRSGRNLADIQRWRLKNRSFLRFVTGFGFFVYACFFFAFFLLEFSYA